MRQLVVVQGNTHTHTHTHTRTCADAAQQLQIGHQATVFGKPKNVMADASIYSTRRSELVLSCFCEGAAKKVQGQTQQYQPQQPEEQDQEQLQQPEEAEQQQLQQSASPSATQTKRLSQVIQQDACPTCVRARRVVAHRFIAVLLQGILIIGAASLFFSLEVSHQMGGAIRLVESGLPHLAVPVPADPQVVGKAHPCSVHRPASNPTFRMSRLGKAHPCNVSRLARIPAFKMSRLAQYVTIFPQHM